MGLVRLSLGLVMVVGFTLAACGSDSGGGEGGNASGTCSGVCGCVVAEGGDSATCQQECQDTVNAGGNQRASCETKLDSFGYPQCKSKCEGFPTS
jgi:hypothetical protein